MSKTIVYKLFSATLIVCLAMQGILTAGAIDVSCRKDDASCVLRTISEKPSLDLLLQNNPKTKTASSSPESSFPVSFYAHWHISHRHIFNADIHPRISEQPIKCQGLHALSCQFTL